MRFAEPAWLLVGAAAVTLLFALLARAERLRARARAAPRRPPRDGPDGRAVAGAAMAPSRRRERRRRAGLRRARAAAARHPLGDRRPRGRGSPAGRRHVQEHGRRRRQTDPARATKLAIRDLVERFPGDRIGLVAFAGDAFLASPMTLDHGALLDTLDAFDTSVVARGGTDIGRAIDVAASTLAETPARQKVAVLLTDGEDLEGHGLDEAKRAAKAGDRHRHDRGRHGPRGDRPL